MPARIVRRRNIDFLRPGDDDTKQVICEESEVMDIQSAYDASILGDEGSNVNSLLLFLSL